MVFRLLVCFPSILAVGELMLARLVAEPVAKSQYTLDEMPLLPQPEWVRMTEHGERDARLNGLRTPAGITVEVVAENPLVVDPVAMTFADDGSLYVLEWREATEQVDTTYDVHYQDGTTATVNRKTKNARDHLKRLIDTDRNGVFDRAELIMDDLEMPSTMLEHDGWMYFPSVGHVIRRRPQADTGSFKEEEILRGLCGYHHHQASGLTLSADNWMYTTSGDDDNIAEGSDGSRATVLRTGAIFRSRPDGSQLSEFARGFRNPYRDVVFDDVYNMFHVDNDQEDGSKFQGVRLMHLLEAADYGWRLEMGAKCCRTDFARGAVFGERPGKMPSMLKTGRGAPAGLLIYQGTAFPDFFRGLLIYPDVYRMKVRGYEVERAGSTFRVVRQFTLMESDDGMFRPVQAATGPDGAIYILDWRTNSGGAGRSWGDGIHGRVYRLTWSGTDSVPAIRPAAMTTWSELADAETEALFEMLTSTRDFDLRERAQRALIERGDEHAARFAEIARETSFGPPPRAVALGAVWQLNAADAHATALRLLSDEAFEIRRLAAESIGHHMSAERATLDTATTLLNRAAGDPHPAVRRASALAAGALAEASESIRVREQVAGALLRTLLATDRSDVYLFDGILRGIERCGDTGIARLTQLAVEGSGGERELATELFLALRTAAAARGLDELLAGDTARFTPSQLERLLRAYRHILVRPAIDASGVLGWLERHPDADASLQVTALETLGLVGGGKSPAVTELTVKLLNGPSSEIRISAIQAAGRLRVIAASRPLFDALRDPRRPLAERREIVKSLALLRAEQWPFADRDDPGVELVLPELIDEMPTWQEPELIADAVWLVGQVDEAKAVSIADQFLDHPDVNIVRAAIDVLGTDITRARELGQRLLAAKLPAETRPEVAAALQRHVATDASGEAARLLEDLYRDSLSISLDRGEVERIKRLVIETGDSRRGRDVFLRSEKSQCINCHRIEGIGGVIGPDLNKIWQTHTIEKIVESIVDPSLEIKEGFETWTVVTTSGKVFGGLKVADGPPQLILRGANGRDYRIDVDDIEEKQASKRSLMPDETVSQMTLTEFVDLVAFLKDEAAQKGLPQYANDRGDTRQPGE